LGNYYLWPFGKYIERIHDQDEFINRLATNNVFEYESDRLKRDHEKRAHKSPSLEDHAILHSTLVVSTNQDTNTTYTVQLSNEALQKNNILYESKKRWSVLTIISLIIFYIFMAPLLCIAHSLCALLAWYGVITIPIAKVHFEGLKLLFRDIKTLNVSDCFPPSPGSDILLCTYQAVNIYYYKYSVFGANVILFNLLFTIPLAIIMGFVGGEPFLDKFALLIFPICLLANVPLSYYIGKSVSTISAQTSFAVGAFLNAAFGSVIELLLYFLSLAKGLEDLVQQAVTGSLIANMLLLPGIAMIFGGLKYKQQFFNRTAGMYFYHHMTNNYSRCLFYFVIDRVSRRVYAYFVLPNLRKL
jgi:Ca2+:H+ antiporter